MSDMRRSANKNNNSSSSLWGGSERVREIEGESINAAQPPTSMRAFSFILHSLCFCMAARV